MLAGFIIWCRRGRVKLNISINCEVSDGEKVTQVVFSYSEDMMTSVVFVYDEFWLLGWGKVPQC